jgi:hypothetical protein
MEATVPSPVMQQAQCVANCTVDTFFINFRRSQKNYGRSDDEYVFCTAGDSESHYVVMPRELGFRLPMSVDSSIGRSNVMSTMHVSPKVFTSLNNFPVSCTRDSAFFQAVKDRLTMGNRDSLTADSVHVLKRLLREMVCRSIIFMGVPLTRVNPAENMSPNVSITVSGTLTVFNTGPNNIEAGQKVAWDVPCVIDGAASSRRIRGEPRGKVFVELAPVQDKGVISEDESRFFDPKKTVRTINNLKDPKIASAMKQSSMYKEYLTFFDGSGADRDAYSVYSAMVMTSGISSRIIGTALTSSAAGGSFDLLLNS